ncbi:Serine threonine- kinase CTR1 [Chlorella sorokiniana]|uniref:Serine threonine-kinase CTR1 n=1 Tax=Chlorella sorokiniana TaxID=3076 RepID=A0A2P6TSJ7_CHLSO|nr:Serine threonine- kinase CTR1 [Chlorella sorokiniana]|eukprot:PRW57024.1 Serine threonine- kinase CTR1 [Chlorella sorokiniana]
MGQNVTLCWGQGEQGQLGNGMSGGGYQSAAPVPVTGSHQFVSVCSGQQHSCALEASGKAWCTGSASQGQLGAGSNASSAALVEVSGGHTFRAITCGASFTCGLDDGGQAWCFGLNQDGQLGSGSRDNSNAGALGQLGNSLNSNQVAPVPVSGGHAFSAISAGGTHTCAIKLDSTTYCFGSSPANGLDSGTNVPRQIAGGHAFVALSAGASTTCGLDSAGSVWCFGEGFQPATAPVQVPGGHTFQVLGEASDATMCAIAVEQAGTDTTASSSSSSSSSVPIGAVAGGISAAVALASGGTSRSSGSGALELRTDARLWEVQWPELTILRLVGRGSFGAVYLADWNRTRVAVKVLVSKDDINRGELQLPERVMRELQAEAAVMSRMRHPNVVQFMGLVALPPALITVKSPNLLVDEHWRVKVSDFNLSKLLEGAQPESSLTSGGATNPIWLAPEVLEGEKATAASDVYSFGMVLYELLTWRLPWSFADMSPFKVGATIRRGGRPEVPPKEQLPGPDTAGWAGLDAYVQLMRNCWAQQPGERPTFDEVVSRLQALLDATPDS